MKIIYKNHKTHRKMINKKFMIKIRRYSLNKMKIIT